MVNCAVYTSEASVFDSAHIWRWLYFSKYMPAASSSIIISWLFELHVNMLTRHAAKPRKEIISTLKLQPVLKLRKHGG